MTAKQSQCALGEILLKTSHTDVPLVRPETMSEAFYPVVAYCEPVCGNLIESWMFKLLLDDLIVVIKLLIFRLLLLFENFCLSGRWIYIACLSATRHHLLVFSLAHPPDPSIYFSVSDLSWASPNLCLYLHPGIHVLTVTSPSLTHCQDLHLRTNAVIYAK